MLSNPVKASNLLCCNRISYLIAILILASASISAQARFTARLDAQQVVVNGVFSIEFVLEQGEGRSFSPPDFAGFEAISGPSTSYSTTIINNRMSKTQSRSYSLMALKEGKFTIGSATITVAGKKMSTDPVSIEVVKGKSKDGIATLPGEQDIFLKAEFDTLPIYPGQQQFLHYRIFTRADIRDYSTLQEDDYADFFFRYVKDFDHRAKRVVIDGLQYTTQVIKSVALFPLKTGVYDIAPLVVNVWIPVPGQPKRSFFSRGRTVNRRITSNPIEIEVLPIPSPVPADFSGAVGKYRLDAKIDKTKLSTDDALVLTLQISGDGDARRLSPPDIGLEDKFEVFEANVISDKSIDQNGKVINTKLLEYLLIPKQPGTIRFNAPFTYLDPDSARYETIRTKTFSVTVTAGKMGNLARQNARNLVKTAEEFPEMMADFSIRKKGKSFFLSTIFWLAGLLPFIFLGIAFSQKNKDSAFLSLSVEERKRLKARKKALSHLEKAESLMENGSSQDYYESISMAIFGYIADKLKIPMSELSKTTVRERMSDHNIPDIMQEQVISSLQFSEQMLYAGGSDEGKRQEVYDRVLNLIMDLEKEL